MSTPFDDAIAEAEQANGPPPDDFDDAAVSALLARNDMGNVRVLRSPYANDAQTRVKPFDLVGPPEGLWAPLEPVTYAIGGLVPQASVTLFAGYSSSLKSWLALAMAFARASGRPWLDHHDFATERGAVTYLDKEAGLYEIRRRLHAIRKSCPDVIDDPALDVCAFPAGGNVFDPDFKRRLEDLAATRSMIFVDTLVAFSSGVDENSAQMAEGVGIFAEIGSRTKCTFVVVAHEKKKGAGGNETDPRERVRGSSSIFGAVDCVFSCQRPAPREPVTVEQTKARNGREADPFTVTMLDVPGGGVRFEVDPVVEATPETPAQKAEATIRLVVEAVRSNPQATVDRLRMDLGIRKSALVEALKVAQELGRIRNVGHAREAKWVATTGGSS